MNTKLKFVNLCNDPSPPAVVFFQEAIADGTPPIAWKVIRHCGYESYHPFVYPFATEVSIRDSYGNRTPRLRAEGGMAFEALATPSGHGLFQTGRAQSVRNIEIHNDLAVGAVDAELFRDGRLLARKTAVAPAQEAVFQPRPVLNVTTVCGTIEGQPLNPFTIGSVTRLVLVGVAEAEIVIIGGGGGPMAKAFTFVMEKVVMF